MDHVAAIKITTTRQAMLLSTIFLLDGVKGVTSNFLWGVYKILPNILTPAI